MFGKSRHHKLRDFVELRAGAEAVLLPQFYYLITSFLALDNAEGSL